VEGGTGSSVVHQVLWKICHVDDQCVAFPASP
jgi:hypothetical protein